MSQRSKWEYLKAIYQRYHQAPKPIKRQILDEFCQICGYNRKYAIRLLNGPPPGKLKERQKRQNVAYGPQVVGILSAIWEAAGYPWSARLKALLPLWLPWVRSQFHLTSALERKLLTISPATIDRRLKTKKRLLKKNLYGRTKPGTLLKHHIPLKTDSWDIHTPGFTEVDLVSHSGDSAEGEFIHSLNLTDIQTTWVETRAVMGKGQIGVLKAMKEIQNALPFKFYGIDSDNGSEFINYHLKAFCDQEQIQFTRSRPYKKDDNAHIEQKNWTHVRKLFGYVRYDSQEALAAMNDLYRNELRLFSNLFLPSVKLVRKERVGSKLKRIYNNPQTPFERFSTSAEADPNKVRELKKLLESLNPFELSRTIDQKLKHIYQMANRRRSSTTKTNSQTNQSESLSGIERETIKTISSVFGIPVYLPAGRQGVKTTKNHGNLNRRVTF